MLCINLDFSDVIVQAHRFDILEEYGCSSVTFDTLASYFLYYMWPVAIGLVSLVYSSRSYPCCFLVQSDLFARSGLILRTFYMRRIQFNHVLASNGMINPSRYLRLMLLAMIDIMCTIPIGTYTIYISLQGVPLNPWKSWADTHFDFKRVGQIPAVIWRSYPTTYTSVQMTRWLPIACAFAFFALFGFAEEAMKNYRRVFWFIAKPLGLGPAFLGASKSGKGKGGILSGYEFL